MGKLAKASADLTTTTPSTIVALLLVFIRARVEWRPHQNVLLLLLATYLIASIIVLSRPSEKLGTHSIKLIL
jgi:hypothetical protein